MWLIQVVVHKVCAAACCSNKTEVFFVCRMFPRQFTSWFKFSFLQIYIPAPSDPVVSCSRPSNSSFRLEITMQNLSECCLDVSNLPQSNFTHRYSVTPLPESAEQYSASFSSGSSVTDVKVSYAGVTYQIEASTAVNGVWSRSSLAFCTTC